MYTLANITNGLVYPHDGVCYFQSNHGHNRKIGYFTHDAMPWEAVVRLLRGEQIKIVDATAKSKGLTDALRYGVTTWAIVFNRGLGIRPKNKFYEVSGWETKEMVSAALSDIHKPLAHSIKKLNRLFGRTEPVIIGTDIILECHRNCLHDDRIVLVKSILNAVRDNGKPERYMVV